MTGHFFIGRQAEFEKLKTTYQKGLSSLVVVKGRRRIGKSRLIAEFAAKTPGSRFLSFAGLAPQKGVTAQIQRDHFGQKLATYLKTPALTFRDWNDAFQHLALHIQPGDIVLFDEISWMGAKDPTFIPKLKAWWDEQSKNMLFVLCGSVSTWIEINILNNTAFFGRITLTLTLEPLSIPESAQFLKRQGFKGSVYETYKLLSILGGIPWYLEQVGSGVTADEIIKTLCFQPEGLLVLEFERIFHDVFSGKGAVYRQILEALKEGMKTLDDIRQEIGFAHSGTLSKLMEHLIVAGFVKKQPLWSFKTGKSLRKSLYRICDPYLRFYLKVIAPNRHKIDMGAFEGTALSSVLGFEAHMGLQLEYLLLQNRKLLLKAIGIPACDVVCDGPYRQFHTVKMQGCQIDYLVQTMMNSLFLCEFKFKRRELGVEVVEAMQEKIQALKIPRGYAAVPVLFHVGSVTTSVYDQGFFYRLIDIGDFLELPDAQ